MHWGVPYRRALALLVLMLVGLSTATVVSDPVYPEVWIIGDSLSRGLYASTPVTMYRQQLVLLLRQRHRHNAERVLHKAVCNLQRAEQLWPTLEGTPNAIFLEIGVNDVTQNVNEDCPATADEEWAARYGAMLDALRARYPQTTVVVATVPWLNWHRRSRAYHRALQFNTWIYDQATPRGVLVADLWAATWQRPEVISRPDQVSTFPPRYRGDNFHPNDQGHRVIATTFLCTLYPACGR